MWRRSVTYLVIASGVIASGPAFAEKWTMKAEAGVVSARGNTDTDSANAKLDTAVEFDKWKHGFGGTAVYVSDATGTTGQRWEAHEQSDYKITAKAFWFGSGRYEHDRFSGFRYQATLGTGFGYRFFDDPVTKLSAQLGAGYRIAETRPSFDEDTQIFTPAEKSKQVIAQASVNFERELTATTKVTNKFLTEWGSDNTFAQNDTSLQVKIMTSLALAVGYSVRYNTDPPEGFRKTDTLTTLNLVYELK
jgi:putative salt-induced outer membrane protein